MSLEDFMQKFGEDDRVNVHNLRSEMTARAIKAIGDSTKITHAGGTCWRYPSINKAGYGVTSVLHKTYVTSRLVLCLASGKPYAYHNDSGEYMEAAHCTPILCRFRDCLNPEHLYWTTKSDNCKRREAEARAAVATEALSALLSITDHLPCNRDEIAV
jgi:hypothetical protein